jgi:hypothetical protein
LTKSSPDDEEKETVLGILIVALGVAITTFIIGGSLGFIFGFVGGAIAATGFVVILRGER